MKTNSVGAVRGIMHIVYAQPDRVQGLGDFGQGPKPQSRVRCEDRTVTLEYIRPVK